MLPRSWHSPRPMETTSGLDGATASAPTEALLIWPSVTGVQVLPPSEVFQSPPPVAPKKYSFGRAVLPAAAIERPPRSGPRLRQVSAENEGGKSAAKPAVVRTRQVRRRQVFIGTNTGALNGAPMTCRESGRCATVSF